MTSTSALTPSPVELAQRALVANQRVQQQLTNRVSELQAQIRAAEALLVNQTQCMVYGC